MLKKWFEIIIHLWCMDWNCLFKTFRWKGLFIIFIYSIVHKGVYIYSSTLLLEAAMYFFFPMLFLYWSVDIIILAQPAGEIACVPLCPATWKTTTIHSSCLFLQLQVYHLASPHRNWCQGWCLLADTDEKIVAALFI